MEKCLWKWSQNNSLFLIEIAFHTHLYHFWLGKIWLGYFRLSIVYVTTPANSIHVPRYWFIFVHPCPTFDILSLPKIHWLTPPIRVAANHMCRKCGIVAFAHRRSKCGFCKLNHHWSEFAFLSPLYHIRKTLVRNSVDKKPTRLSDDIYLLNPHFEHLCISVVVDDKLNKDSL